MTASSLSKLTGSFARLSTKTKRRAQVLLVGTGRMGQIRAKILHSNPRVDLCGIVDPKAKNDLAEMYKVPAHESLEEAFQAQPNSMPLDAVVVCSPTNSHSDVILQAAEHGLDVFVEKPIAESASAIEYLFEQTSQFTHANRSRPVALCCGFQRRFDPSYQAAAMRHANVGIPVTARIFFGDHPVPPMEFLLDGGDIFMDLAAHDVDYITHIWSQYPVESVFAVATASSPQLAEAGVQDHATILLHFQGGAVATLFLSRSAVYGYDQRFELFGTQGLVSIGNIPEHATTVHNSSGSHAAPWQYSFPQRFEHAFVNELDAFLDTVLDDKPWPVSRDQCLYVQSIVDAAQMSAKLGEVVRLQVGS